MNLYGSDRCICLRAFVARTRSSALRQKRQHGAIVRGEIGLRDALDVGGRQALEDVELAVRRLDVVMDDDGVRQDARLVLIRLAIEDVIARELVLRALQLAIRDGLVL